MVIFTSCSSITLNFDGGHNLIDLMLFRKQWAFNLPLWYNWNTEKWYQTAQGQRTKKHFSISCNVVILHTAKTIHSYTFKYCTLFIFQNNEICSTPSNVSMTNVSMTTLGPRMIQVYRMSSFAGSTILSH